MLPSSPSDSSGVVAPLGNELSMRGAEPIHEAVPARFPWERKTVPLKACIGDWPALTMPLDLMVCDTDFTCLPAEIEVDSLPPLVKGCRGYLIRSCPAGDERWRLRRKAGHLFYAPRRYQRHWVALDGSFDAYLAKLSGKTRSTLKRKRRKFEADAGGHGFQVYRTPEEMAEFHRLARPISAESYQERLLGQGLPMSAGFQESMRERAAGDQVRGYLLFHQGKAVAYTYAPVEDGAVIYDHTGFDAFYRALSPGTVLQLLVLESLFAEGRFRLFDFTEGEGDHKALFGTHQQACMDLYILPYGIGAFGAVIVQTAIERSSEIAAQGLEQIGVKRRLKNWLRGG